MQTNVLMDARTKEEFDKLEKEARYLSCSQCKGDKAMKFNDIYICLSSKEDNRYRGKKICVLDKILYECFKHVDDYVRNENISEHPKNPRAKK